jgi:uncharacterized protein (UPF0276 family)
VLGEAFLNMFKNLGHGIGLRPPHYAALLEDAQSAQSPARSIDWLEVITENFMVAGGNPRRVLRAVRERWPVVLHGVSLSLGSTDPLDERYLDALDALQREIEPAWISDHLCWTSVGGHHVHDLLPLPYTEEALDHVAARVARVQDRLKRPILVENVSSYLGFEGSTMGEAEFLRALCDRAGCGVLLDVNNVYVSACNHGFDARAFLDAIPVGRVGQVHLAGHSQQGALKLDTHDHPVCDEVWSLYAYAIERFGAVSTLIEWDDRLPPLERVVEESRRAAAVASATVTALGALEARGALGPSREARRAR